MRQVEIQIDTDLAITFERQIYLDIAAYIQSHQKEYQEFILRENGGEDSED